ncbi:MAG: transcriptional regulator, HxlR family [Candidatus Saccharibacteria bacterium]|nr:transcriptional regulator, HxlR family [Candidatus Saccharibacteria bacterium]
MVGIENNECSAPTVLSLIASKWTIMAMHALQKDTLRYSEISRAIPLISQKVLTDTLRKLERNGIIERTVYPVVPPKVEYKLTDLGTKLLLVTEVMAQWADDHIEAVWLAQKTYDEGITVR